MSTVSAPMHIKPTRRDRSRTWVYRILVGALIFLMVAPPGLEYGTFGTVDLKALPESNPVNQLLQIIILIIGLLIVLMNLRKTMRIFKEVNPYFWAFMAFAILSLVWSIDPELTVKRLFRWLVQCSVMVLVAVSVLRWERDHFQKFMRPILSTIMLGSIVFVLVRPDLAVHQEAATELLGSWKGLTMQKNVLGPLAGISCIFWLQGWMSRSVSGIGLLVGAGSSAICLLMSRSNASLMSTVFACCTMFLLMRAPGSMRKTMPYAVMALSVTLVLYALAVLRVIPGLEFLLSPIPALTGKDLTFSGRSDIWAAIVSHIQLRPWAGSGYGAFWAGPYDLSSESHYLLAVMRGFYPGSAHNGYLDVINDLGFIGGLLLLAYLLRFVADAMKLYRFDRHQGALFIGLFMQQAISNLSESCWLNTRRLEFVIMTMATACLARALYEARQNAKASANQTEATHRPGTDGR